MKKVVLFLVIGLILLAIPATVYLVGQRQEVRKRAAPATTLSLSPATNTKQVGDSFKLNATIDPGANQVTTVKVYLTFDPTKLEATAITNGANAPRVLNSGIIESGTATITVGAASNAQPITTKGTVAVLTLTAKAETGGTPTSVQYASNTFVGGIQDTTSNVLVGTTAATVTIGTGTLTATPSATPSATPRLTITPTVTPVASGSAEASPSALVILTGTPSDATGSAEASASAELSTSQPTIRGKAPPGSTVTVTIYSDPQTCVVEADENGDWECIPDEPLDAGPHNIVASVITASGDTQTDSSTIVVEGEEGEEIPVSGSVELTWVLLGIAVLFIVSGAFVPLLLARL